MHRYFVSATVIATTVLLAARIWRSGTFRVVPIYRGMYRRERGGLRLPERSRHGGRFAQLEVSFVGPVQSAGDLMLDREFQSSNTQGDETKQ